MNYAYVRVSTEDQHIDRQIDDILKFGIEKKNIYVDKESGKDFNRPAYKKLIKTLKKDDLLIIKAIDRLGRNYDMIIEEWKRITKIIQAQIFVIDMPILDTRKSYGNNLIGNFISDIVLQLLSFVAQTERETMKQRQKEGIRTAKARGVKFGRPRTVKIPENFSEIGFRFLKHEISNVIAAKIANLSRASFYRFLHIQKPEIDKIFIKNGLEPVEIRRVPHKKFSIEELKELRKRRKLKSLREKRKRVPLTFDKYEMLTNKIKPIKTRF